MDAQTCDSLRAKKCLPCEGGVDRMTEQEALAQLSELSGWDLTHQGERIQKNWEMKNFLAAINFFNEVAHLAEQENHHPDLHLSQYRKVSIEIWTHAIGGLSINDFILAAKIDALDPK